jgi:quercetin dioxygenase-like cupin family protein
MSSFVRLGIVVIALPMLGALADPAPHPQRVIIERHDETGVAGREIVIGTGELPPGTAIGFHVHPGDEIGYVLAGSLVLKTRGKPDRLLKPGDTFFNERGVVHSLEAAPDGPGGRVVSTWVIDKNQPFATPVP